MYRVLHFLLVIMSVIAATSAAQSWNWKDEIAEASCVGLSTTRGWTYAVRRPCHSGITCRTICEDRNLANQDSQLRPLLLNPGLRLVLLGLIFCFVLCNPTHR